MRKQLISFAQVMNFSYNIKLKGGYNPNPPPLRTPLVEPLANGALVKNKASYCSYTSVEVQQPI